jgi:predicted dithiol-disulfide oxidoreductase (DUF899 family)
MRLPEIVPADEWQDARERLLVKEKEATRARDALAAERRRLPMVRFDSGYRFEGSDGEASLVDLFEGRRQLVVYHFMFQPGDTPCDGCSMFVDTIGHLAHLHARDTSLALVSPASVPELEGHRERMGWTVPWYSTSDGFNAACGITTGFGLSAFLRDGEDVFRSYFTTGRSVDAIGNHWSFLDLTALGRQETWEDSPEGYPQTPPYGWWRFHDEYDR